MMRSAPGWLFRLVLVGMAAAGTTCGDDDDESTGQPCSVVGDCFAKAEEPLKGTALCLDRVPGGYCTHTCVTDADCCAVKGECQTTFKQVCAPFESTGMKMCFLSCEPVDLATGQEANVFCQGSAHSAFACRSSGGGGENRKICVP